MIKILILFLFAFAAYADDFKYDECQFVFSPPESGPTPEGYNVYVRQKQDLRVINVGTQTSAPCDLLLKSEDSGKFFGWAKSYIGDKESTRSPVVPFSVKGDTPTPSPDDPQPPATFDVILK